MTSPVHLTTLITLLYGLMIAELFASTHRLIRHRRRIRWHWLPLAVAWYVLIVILKNWWGLVGQEGGPRAADGWTFLYYAHLLFLFYLVVSAVLPDEIPDEGLDLREYYLENRRHLWGLMACVSLLLLLVSLLRPIVGDAPFNGLAIGANAFMLVINLSLVRIRRLAYHVTVVSLLMGHLVLEVLHNFR